MTHRTFVVLLSIIVAGAVGVWLLFVTLPEVYDEAPDASPAEDTAERSQPTRMIAATLFYVSEDGMRLVGVERDVAHGAGTTEQAKRIIEHQLLPPESPLASAVPDGTMLRALYLSERGDAFVDLSREVSAEHSGGSLDELFTIYTIVNTLTVNLPAVRAVQILIEGREVDTLAGHVDLRRPLEQNLKWVDQSRGTVSRAPAQN